MTLEKAIRKLDAWGGQGSHAIVSRAGAEGLIRAVHGQLHGDLLSLCEALRRSFSCERESEGGHDNLEENLEECWHCWASSLLSEHGQ